MIAVCEKDPKLAGIVAHFLSVSFDVLRCNRSSTFEVGVYPPFSLTESEHVVAVGESPRFAVLDATTPALAYVTVTGFSSSSIERKAQSEAAPVFRLDGLCEVQNADVVDLADACVELSRRILAILSPTTTGDDRGLSSVDQFRD